MRAVILVVAFLVADLHAASAYEHFVSPNRRFEANTTAKEHDGTGMKLFVRRARSSDEGKLLLHNDRWIDAKWSPDSRLLAVVDHLDGHVADVYVFAITAADAAESPVVTLLYHTPDLRTYDVQWDVLGWRTRQRQIILKKEVRDQTAGTFRREKIVARIGTEALKLPTDKT